MQIWLLMYQDVRIREGLSIEHWEVFSFSCSYVSGQKKPSVCCYCFGRHFHEPCMPGSEENNLRVLMMDAGVPGFHLYMSGDGVRTSGELDFQVLMKRCQLFFLSFLWVLLFLAPNSPGQSAHSFVALNFVSNSNAWMTLAGEDGSKLLETNCRRGSAGCQLRQWPVYSTICSKWRL